MPASFFSIASKISRFQTLIRYWMKIWETETRSSPNVRIQAIRRALPDQKPFAVRQKRCVKAVCSSAFDNFSVIASNQPRDRNCRALKRTGIQLDRDAL